MEDVEKVNEDFNVKKSKKKGLIIGISIGAVVLLIIAAILVFLLMPKKPQQIFSKAIDNMFTFESQEYNSIKASTKVKVSVDANDSSMQEQLKEISKFTLSAGTQVDAEAKKEIVDLGLKYDGDSVIDARVYTNSNEMYAYFEGIYDKYIQIDMTDEQKEQLNEIFNTASSKENMKNNQKAMDIVRDELKTQIEAEGEYEQDKVTIEIGEKEKQVTKSTLTVSEKQMYKILENMCTNLADNDKFLDCFETSIKSELKDAAKALKDMDGDSKNKLKISIYTDGLLNDIVGVNVEVYAAEEDSTILLTVLKEDKDLYTFTASMKQTGMKIDIVTGKLEIEKDKDSKKEQSGKAIFTLQITGVGKAKLEMDYDVEYNNGIDKVDTSNSVNMTKLTDKDLNGILEKLQKRPLVGDIIKNYMYTSTSVTPSTSTITTPNTTAPTTSNNNSSTVEQNEVRYDYAGYAVKYSVPSNFKYESSYSYDYNKSYSSTTSDKVDVKVTVKWDSEEDYKKDIVWDRDYYTDSSYYKNVKLDDIKTVKVEDKEFKYQILSYESDSSYYESKYQKAYVWYVLDKDAVFAVEIDSTDKTISEDIIKGFLNITVTKTK